MADLVGKLLKRSLHQTQWGDYERGEAEPPYDVVEAAARVSELTPEYIAFGVTDQLIDPSRDRKLTEEGPDSDRARAERAAAAADARAAKPSVRKAGGGGSGRHRS